MDIKINEGVEFVVGILTLFTFAMKAGKWFLSGNISWDKEPDVDKLIETRKSWRFSRETEELLEQGIEDACFYQNMGIKAEGKRRIEISNFYQLVQEQYGKGALKRAIGNLKLESGKWSLRTNIPDVMMYGIMGGGWAFVFFLGWLLLFFPTLFSETIEGSISWCGIGLIVLALISVPLLFQPWRNFDIAGKMLGLFFAEKIKGGECDSEELKIIKEEARVHKAEFNRKKIISWSFFAIVFLVNLLLIVLAIAGHKA